LRASSFSNQVHSGIYALIASIVIAIVIILYFFRGNLNFYKENKNLKLVAYIWIVLNTLLVVNIIIKDAQYIYYFGLTYKRIGVLMYLLLTIIGLVTTSIKVKNIKNFWYLFRINTLAAFTILVVSCTINWDSYITIYNLNYSKSMDFKYLIELSDNNTFILKNHFDKHDLDDYKTSAVNKKYKNYLKMLNKNSWQEIQFDNLKIK
jgi:phosphatidylserine synthase